MQSHILKRIGNRDEITELHKLAAAENHLIISPSHLFEKNKEIVGYCSIGAMPLVMSFFSSSLQVRDSIKFIDLAEVHMRALGQKYYFTTCFENSPFFPVMSKLGFKEIGQTHLFSKEI